MNVRTGGTTGYATIDDVSGTQVRERSHSVRVYWVEVSWPTHGIVTVVLFPAAIASFGRLSTFTVHRTPALSRVITAFQHHFSTAITMAGK